MISKNFENLFIAAKEVRLRAHVPYSNFHVGTFRLVKTYFSIKDF